MQTSTVLPLMSFSHSKIQLEIAFSCPVPLGLLQYRTISWSFFFVFHDHDTLKSSSLVFCRFPSVCLTFPMKLYFVGKPSHRWWYHLIIAGSTWHWHGQLEMLTLITGLRWCLQISSPQLLCFSFIFSSSKVSYWVQPTVKGGRIKLPLLEGVKNLQAMWETWVQSLGWEDPLEEGMATHSSMLAWRIPMDRGAWWATVHGVTEWDTTKQLSTAQHRPRVNTTVLNIPGEVVWGYANYLFRLKALPDNFSIHQYIFPASVIAAILMMISYFSISSMFNWNSA